MAGNSLQHYQKCINNAYDAKEMVAKKQNEQTISAGSHLEGWRGTAVNSGLFGNYTIPSTPTTWDPIAYGSTKSSSSSSDTIGKIAQGLSVAAGIIGVIGTASSIFGSKKNDVSLDNQLTKSQRQAISEQTRETNAIQDDLANSINSVDSFLNSGNNDALKAASLATTLKNYIESAQSRKNILSNKASTLDRSITNKKNSFDEKNARKSTLTDEKNKLGVDLDNLKNMDTTNMTEAEKANHQKQIQNLETQIKEKDEAIKNLDKEMKALKAEIENLTKEKNQYIQQANNLDEAIKKAAPKMTELNNITKKED